jgi:hypothetical protein
VIELSLLSAPSISWLFARARKPLMLNSVPGQNPGQHAGIRDTGKREDKIHRIERSDRQVYDLARLESACARSILLLEDDRRIGVYIYYFAFRANL